jgi:hypothetical protein
MPRHKLQLLGQKFGNLTVLKESELKRYGCTWWECLCDCGNTVIVKGAYLNSGHTKSCGCSRTTHGMSGTALHNRWVSMMRRCYAPKNGAFASHGGRGIKVCRRWHQFENFARDMGPTFNPKLTLERIDNDGNYTPKNCRWATRKEQSRNTRNSRLVEYKGRMITIAELAETTGISRHVLLWRLNKN